MSAAESEQNKPTGEGRHDRPEGGSDEVFTLSSKTAEPRSWAPWIVASAVVVACLVALFFFAGRSKPSFQSGTTGMAPAAAYATHLAISGLSMSEASSFSGSKVTYIDGQIANTGDRTLTSITVQVGFRNDLGQLADREVMPLALIRTREPYVDTEPVSATPLKPGDKRDFRLIFDSMPDDWNQQYPEIRVVAVH
jgi:hypothetical protein